MNNKPPIRLGPLALLLLVVSIALSTLAILSFTTARADDVLAKRFAQSVHSRYALEKEGSKFVYDLRERGVIDNEHAYMEEGKLVYQRSEEGYTITVEIDPATYEVTKWQIHKEWEYDDTIDNLWNGE